MSSSVHSPGDHVEESLPLPPGSGVAFQLHKVDHQPFRTFTRLISINLPVFVDPWENWSNVLSCKETVNN